MATTAKHAARILGLDNEATLEDVRRVRRKMARKYHPDCAKDPEQATRHMARINAAADTLTAHIEKQTKGARADYSEFFARKTRAKKAAHAEADKRKSETPKTETPKTAASSAKQEERRDTRSNFREAAQTSTRSAKPMSAARKRELALVQMASASYRSVLDRISRIDTGARVDVQVMSFASAT